MSDSEDDCSDNTSGVADWPVTEEWLQDVLKEHHKDLTEPTGITIIDFTVKPGCETGESVLSDILAVTVTYCLRGDPEGPEHSLNFIIKLLPQDPFSRFFVTEAQFDLREIKFYTQVVPDIRTFKNNVCPDDPENDFFLPIPKCYYAHYSSGDTEPEPVPPSSVLVLENLKPNGYQSVNFAAGLDLKQARAAVEAIAKVHALSLCLKINEGQILSEKYPFLFQTSQASDSYQQLVERGLPQLFEFLNRKKDLKNVLNQLNELRPHTKEVIQNLLSPEEPMALITHTDFWCNNLMFKPTSEDTCECAILDWQMVTYSRPTNDLALLLVSSVSADLRRQHTQELLDIYWEKLTSICRRLKTDVEENLGYDRAKLGNDFRKAQLLALLLCIGSVDLALGNAQMEDRLVELLKDLHEEDLLSPQVGSKSA